MTIKRTPLYDVHVQLNAKLAPFAGYEMPIQYTGINLEHEAVRNRAGIFDVSHMGEFIVKGPDAITLVQLVSTNDAGMLYNGKVQYSCMTNEKGGIVDDLLVYRLDEQSFLLVVNASNIQKDWDHISGHAKGMNVELKNISDETALIALQGPKAVHILQVLTDIPLAEMEYYTFARGWVGGFDNVLVSATGYTGAGGFEIYCKNEQAVSLWQQMMKAGESYGLAPAGLGARDTLRLEKGFCLYGNDINDDTLPLEAGLGWITKFNKHFVSDDILQKAKQEGLSKRLVGFEVVEKGIARHGYPIADAENRVIGEVTSGTQSPTLKKSIGMGYVSPAFAKPGSEIFVIVREKPVKAVVCKLPFL